ncbi:MAG: hypothetical protein ACPGSD_15965 [Flavobacteriales bacterium]
MTEEEYIKFEIINGLTEIKQISSPLIQLTIVCQNIEAMGAMLDKKPFACPGQSKKRFDQALETLFPERYKKMNPKSVFYHAFRCSIIHYFQLHRNYQITPNTNLHLKWEERTVQVHIESLINDAIKAAEFLIELFEKNQLKRKKTGSLGLSFG